MNRVSNKRILLFSVMIASLIIYNTTETILDETDYKKLEMMIDLSSTIKLKSNLPWQISANSELRHEGAVFMCVVRDSESLSEIDPNEIDFFLKLNFNFNDPYGEIGYRNRIRKNMVDYFKRVESIHLPTPFVGLSPLNEVTFYEDYEQEFRHGISYLCTQIKEKIPVKSVNNLNL